MARVHRTFRIDAATPDLAQELFVRDIVSDLHRDGRFVTYREEPERLGTAAHSPEIAGCGHD